MKKFFFLSVVGMIITGHLYAQNVSTAISETKFISISKEPPKPANIIFVDGSLRFTDKDGNGKINVTEPCSLDFILKNIGKGAGFDLQAKLWETGHIEGLEYNPATSLGSLDTGKILNVSIPVTGNMSLHDGKASFKLYVAEANHWGTDTVKLEVQTKKFLSPLVKAMDYTVTSEKGSVIQKKWPFKLQALLQNVGQGPAENIIVNVVMPDNIICLTSNLSKYINSLKPGEENVIEYELVANDSYINDEIPIKFNISEKYGKYAKDTVISLAMNQHVSMAPIIVQGKDEKADEIIQGSLISNVDKDIPVNNEKFDFKYAVIIGNENYQDNSGSINPESDVAYAKNDARTFRDYLVNTLGFELKNIRISENASSATMNRLIEWLRLCGQARGGEAELTFYYVGHGFSDGETHIPYLLPVDVTTSDLNNAVTLSEIYNKLGQTGAKRITLFADACFSGLTRGDKPLLAARTALIKPRQSELSGNMVLFSACTGEQPALAYEKQKHGLFTYFLLNKIKESKGDVTYNELSEYLKQRVSITSLTENNRQQNPEVNVSPAVQQTWKSWKLK